MKKLLFILIASIFVLLICLKLNLTIDFNQKEVLAQTGSPAPTPNPANDWPQLQHDAGHSGYSPDTYGPNAQDKFPIKWRMDATTNPKAPPVSGRVQPVIAYNLVYLPSNDGSLYAYNIANGSKAWSYATNGPLVATAGIDMTNQTALVGSQDRFIYGLNATTGTFKWKYDTGARIRVAPVIDNGRVFIANNSGKVICLNTSNGTLIWSKMLDAPILETPAYDANKLFVGTMSSMAYALDANNGNIVWQKQLNGQGMRDRWITAGNGYVFFNPIPLARDIDFGTKIITDNYQSPWATQRTAILNFLAADKYHHPTYIFTTNEGNEIVPPLLYSTSGSYSEYSQPVVLPNGKFNVIYRYSEGLPNHPQGYTCSESCNFWSQYLGEYSPITNDITQLDTWGTDPDVSDTSKKIWFISDESTQLVRSGNIIYADSARGTVGFDTLTKAVFPFSSYNKVSGGQYWDPSVMFYPNQNEWVLPYPGAEIDSDGNNYKRPTPIANGVFYVLHNSVLIAVQGTKK